MKQIIILMLMLATFLVSVSGQAQQKRYPAAKTSKSSSRPRTRENLSAGPLNVVKINPLSLVALTGNLGYERVLGEKISGQVSVQYTPGFTFRGFDFSGYSVTPEVRYYVSGAAPRGFFLAPYFRYRHNTIRGDVTVNLEGQERTIDGKLGINGYSGGVIAGGQFLLSERISLEAFFGPNLSGYAFKASEGTTKKDYNVPGGFSTVWFRSGITLGITF